MNMRAMRRGGDLEMKREPMSHGRMAYDPELRLGDRRDKIRTAVRLLVLGSIGKPWNAIYSRISNLPEWAWARRDHALLRDAIDWVIVMPGKLQHGTHGLVLLGPECGGMPLEAGQAHHVAYVDASGIIRRSPRGRDFSRGKGISYREMSDGTLIAKDEKGIWYRFTVEECSQLEVVKRHDGCSIQYMKGMWRFFWHRPDIVTGKSVQDMTNQLLLACDIPFKPHLRHAFVQEAFPGVLCRIVRKLQIGKADLFKLGLRPKPRRALPVA